MSEAKSKLAKFLAAHVAEEKAEFEPRPEFWTWLAQRRREMRQVKTG